jgi:cation:H+ antiporter
VVVSILASVLGLVLLAKAADQLVAGAARLAALWRVPPIVIGALIIGFGTSAPELMVSGLAAAGGDIGLAIGNVVGSNIANLSLVLGLAALLVPVAVASGVVRREMPLSAAAAAVFAVLVWNGLTPIDGVVLAAGLVAAVAITLRGTRTGSDAELAGEVSEYLAEEDGAPTRVGGEVARTLLGLALTLLGAQLLVSGATDIASDLGLSEGFVGLTLVAVGTSLPELVTAIAAARRGEDELIVGNLVGSDILNSLAVGAVIALVGPGALDDPR